MTNGAITEESQEALKELVGEVVGDKNNNGNVKVTIKSLLPPYMGGYESIAAPLFTGDYVLFIIGDPSPWGEDIFVEKISLLGAAVFEASPYFYGSYACILNTDERDVEEAERIVAAILESEESD